MEPSILFSIPNSQLSVRSFSIFSSFSSGYFSIVASISLIFAKSHFSDRLEQDSIGVRNFDRASEVLLYLINLLSSTHRMYHLLTSVYQEWTRKKQFNVLVLGQGSVGKSSLLECIKSQYNKTPSLSIDRISKTVGQNGRFHQTTILTLFKR